MLGVAESALDLPERVVEQRRGLELLTDEQLTLGARVVTRVEQPTPFGQATLRFFVRVRRHRGRLRLAHSRSDDQQHANEPQRKAELQFVVAVAGFFTATTPGKSVRRVPKRRLLGK